MVTRTLLLSLVLVGCAASTADSDAGDVTTDNGASEEPAPLAAAGSFTADFDGCVATVSYDGLEDRSQPWLCPECDTMYRGTWDSGDCFEEPSGEAWFGEGNGFFYATHDAHDRLTEKATAGLETSASDHDPMHGMTPPDSYDCGWRKVDPEPYAGPWTFSEDSVLDGWFTDECDEPVRLRDQLEGYMVIDYSAIFCEPCQRMAGDEPAFHDEMEVLGVDVEVVTLLVTNVSKVLENAPTAQDLADWSDAAGLSGPVLSDRGWGHWVAGWPTKEGDVAMDEYAGVGLPTWMVVAPDGRVLKVNSGYSSWATIQSTILDDADAQR